MTFNLDPDANTASARRRPAPGLAGNRVEGVPTLHRDGRLGPTFLCSRRQTLALPDSPGRLGQIGTLCAAPQIPTHARKLECSKSDAGPCSSAQLLAEHFSSVFQNYVVMSSPSRLDAEGRIAIVTTREAGLRWTQGRRARFIRADERRRCGRRSRVVLTPRRWC